MTAKTLRKFSPRLLVRRLNRFNFRRRQECRILLHWLAPRSGESILDIGCGDGDYTEQVSRCGARVLGIDIHPRWLPFAQRYRSSENCTFIHMNAEEMGMQDGSFDKLLSLCVIEHFQDDQSVLHHAERVLRPGGRFFFSADSLSNPGITDQERSRHRLRFAVNTFYDTENVRAKLIQAGFTVERTQYILQRPFDLLLVRFSWKLDDLPRFLGIIRILGTVVLWGAYGVSTFFLRHGAQTAGGLTLLVQAVKEEKN